jgi:hypothetical protein
MRKLAIIIVAAGGFGCAGGDSGDDGHDVIVLRMATNEAQSPFEGTVSVEASLEYGNCLLDFYAGDGAQLTADGVEGAEVFDDWSTRLCDHESLDAPADCDVVAHDQRLDNAFLRVDYEVRDLLQNHELAFGPIPAPSLTGCDSVMSVTGNHQLTGFDLEGEPLWVTSSWRPEKAASGDQQAIRIYAAAAE